MDEKSHSCVNFFDSQLRDRSSGEMFRVWISPNLVAAPSNSRGLIGDVGPLG